MLKIPFKETETISLIKPLQDAIVKVFQEDPQNYSDDFDELSQLRLAVQNPQDHEASVQQHLIYYCQLHYLESKFQFDEDHVNVFFTWANAFGVQDAVSSHNIGFEKASVLFNLGAIYNHLGISVGMASEEAIKKSAHYFQLAAGVYQTITDKLATWNISGNANTQLSALSNLNLACAQEVFLQKATNQKMKEGTLAKLAMQVSQFYCVAYDIASQTEIFNKNWLSHMQTKQHHFAGLAQFFKSIECEGQGKYGEQVGWLAASVASFKSALDKNLVKYIQNDSYLEELKTLQSKVDVQYQKANKDNDKIYMEAIPKELVPLPPARMVNPISVQEVKELSSMVSRPFFRHLVPYKVHQAVSKYTYKKDQLVKSLVSKLSEANTIAHTTLASQRLPASIEALEQPIGLPGFVLERSQEIRGKGGSRYLDSSWETLTAFSKRDLSILTEAMAVLFKESQEDAELRRIHGTKWTRAPSETLTTKLTEKSKEYGEKIDSANRSNAIVKSKMEQSMHLIQSLEMDRKELEASIPSSTQSSTLALRDPNLKDLKQLLNDLNTNIKKKKDLAEKIKKTGEVDDIAAKMTMMTLNEGFDESLFIEEQLRQYDAHGKVIGDLVLEQEKLLDAIYLKNKEFLESSKTNAMIREREQALSNLESGYKYFKDISGNLEEGIKFFSEMESVLNKFHNTHCLDFVKARDIEKEQLLAQIKASSAYPLPPTGGFSSPSSVHNGPGTPGVWQPNQTPQYSFASTYQPTQQLPPPQSFTPSQNQPFQPQFIPGQWNPQPYQQPSSVTPGQWNPNQPPQYASQGGYRPPVYWDQNQPRPPQ